MSLPWRTLDRVDTAEGPLELRQRGEQDFLITVAGRVLMTSAARRSEEALSVLALEGVKARAPRVLIGGLGMAYTLRAALDVLPREAKVVVAELTAQVEIWCRGPLAVLTANAASDPRVSIVIDDVARVIAAGKARFEAIVLDLYEGPYAATQAKDHPIFGQAALHKAHVALTPGGVLAIWSEDLDPGFPKRLEKAGFGRVRHERTGKGGRAHVIYLAER